MFDLCPWLSLFLPGKLWNGDANRSSFITRSLKHTIHRPTAIRRYNVGKTYGLEKQTIGGKI